MSVDLVFKYPEYIVKVILLFITIPLGICGNILVMLALWKKRSLRTTTNFLLLNLAISDLMTLVFGSLMAIPELMTLEEVVSSDILCMFFVSYNVPLTTSIVSIFTLTVLAIERYHAIVKPMRTGVRLKGDTVKYACLGVWLTGIILALPFYIFTRYRVSSCRQVVGPSFKKPFEGFQLFLVVVIILLPFFIICFCYCQILRELYFKKKVGPQNIAVQEETREKRKLFKLSLTITGVFVLFLFPYAIILSLKSDHRSTFERYSKLAAVGMFSSAGVNPLIYAFQSTNFRQAFKEILKKPCIFESRN